MFSQRTNQQAMPDFNKVNTKAEKMTKAAAKGGDDDDIVSMFEAATGGAAGIEEQIMMQIEMREGVR